MKTIKLLLSITLLLGASILQGASIPKEKVIRPADTQPFQASTAELVKYGEELWNDKSLSKKGKKACASCHKGNTKMFKKTFKEPYPHMVKMAKSKSKLLSIDAEQMVQFCMLAPMKADIFPWDSKELAALTAYTVEVAQKQYVESKSK